MAIETMEFPPCLSNIFRFKRPFSSGISQPAAFDDTSPEIAQAGILKWYVDQVGSDQMLINLSLEIIYNIYIIILHNYIITYCWELPSCWVTKNKKKNAIYKRRVAPDAPEVPEAILLECGHAGGLMLPSLPSVGCGEVLQMAWLHVGKRLRS